MTRAEAVKMLKSEKEIVCLDLASYVLCCALAIELLSKGHNVAKVTKPSKGEN